MGRRLFALPWGNPKERRRRRERESPLRGPLAAKSPPRSKCMAGQSTCPTTRIAFSCCCLLRFWLELWLSLSLRLGRETLIGLSVVWTCMGTSAGSRTRASSTTCLILPTSRRLCSPTRCGRPSRTARRRPCTKDDAPCPDVDFDNPDYSRLLCPYQRDGSPVYTNGPSLPIHIVTFSP